jgi:predicted nucleic acid-binding protein
MGPLAIDDLPDQALVLVDSAPIISVIERHPRLGARFAPLFAAQDAGRLRLAVTTMTIAEILVGPLRAGEEALARRYRAVLESWQTVPLDAAIAESAARLRAAHRLGLADAVQAASALAIGAAALVTHGRDLARLRGLHVIA